jgi:hypothetical protein
MELSRPRVSSLKGGRSNEGYVGIGIDVRRCIEPRYRRDIVDDM